MSPDLPLLSLLIWVPIIGGAAVLAVGAGSNGTPAVRWLSLIISLVTLILGVALWSSFDRTTHAMQFEEQVPWVPVFDITYHLGVDGISMPLVVLTAFVTVLVVIAGWEVIRYRVAQYMASFLI